nr:hypothetical protein CFP56_70407 [Quercus suber]
MVDPVPSGRLPLDLLVGFELLSAISRCRPILVATDSYLLTAGLHGVPLTAARWSGDGEDAATIDDDLMRLRQIAYAASGGIE